MNQKTKSLLIAAGAFLALAALALPKIGSFDSKNKNNDAARTAGDQAMPVRTLIVQPQKLSDKVATVGTILPNEEVEIRSEGTGKIERIFFKEGGKVKKGELLLKINDAELQAQLLRAQNRLAMAERQEKRQSRLFSENLTSKEDYDNAVSELNIAKAELQLIAAQLAKTEIRAPFDGIVGLRFVSEGSYLSPTTPITTLQDISVVKIDFKIPEKYAAAIQPDRKINFKVHGTSRQFVGTIYATDNKIDTATRTLHVLALSPNPDGGLLAGAFVNVEVALEEREALMIPAQALIPELKGHRVFLYKDGKALSQPVEIGVRTDESVAITSGVQAGDTLITSAILQLRPGMAVRLAESNQ
jgi:membrane fusion protein (multidrug efflux system)